MDKEVKSEKKVDAASRVLSLVSHKLKTPLSIMNGYTEAMLSQIKPEDKETFNAKALSDISKQGEKLAILIDKLVRFTSVSGLTSEEVKKQDTNVKALFSAVSSSCILRDDALSIMSSDATIRRSGPVIDIKCPDDVSLFADKALVSIALEELVDNSIKFNNNTVKKIKLFYYEQDGKQSLAVADNGVGIKEEDLNLIFEKFYQVDDFFTGQIEGWGLGLALVKMIMNLHNGEISVRSQYGIGTIISLRFPKNE